MVRLVHGSCGYDEDTSNSYVGTCTYIYMICIYDMYIHVITYHMNINKHICIHIYIYVYIYIYIQIIDA